MLEITVSSGYKEITNAPKALFSLCDVIKSNLSKKKKGRTRILKKEHLYREYECNKSHAKTNYNLQ